MYRKLIIFVLCLFSGTLFAQNRVQDYINGQMKSDSLLTNAVVAILAIDANGNEIASWNPDMPLLTASTMKTITTGVALEVLGADYRFPTRIAYSGNINKRGVLKGDLYIVGGADPTLGSKDTIAFSTDSIFGIWAQAITDAGITKIDGRIVGDDRYLDYEVIPASWCWSDLGYDYGSGPSGLSFCENLTYFEVEAGKNVGDNVKITPIAPYSPSMTYINQVVTGEKGAGEDIRYRTSDLTPYGKFSGEYGVDRRKDTIAFSNKFGTLACAGAFRTFLGEYGIECEGITDPQMILLHDVEPLQPQDSLIYIAETYSPELYRIIQVTNRISNNFFAETMLRTIGKTLSGEGDYYSATQALKEFLKSRGVSVWGLTQDDGSGLSRENYVSPRFFCNYYTMMSESATFAQFFESLPGPGRPGTLKTVLKNADPALKATIRAKSGSLSSVRCYAGYVDSSKGLFKFAILVNNFACPTRMVQPKIEGFMEQLASYGAEQ